MTGLDYLIEKNIITEYEVSVLKELEKFLKANDQLQLRDDLNYLSGLLVLDRIRIDRLEKKIEELKNERKI